MRVLIVDDDASSVRAVASGLPECHLHFAATIQAAFAEVVVAVGREEPFDAVLSELHLVDGSAEQLLVELERQRDVHASRLLVCSAGAPRTVAEAAFVQRLGARFMLKPVSVDRIRAALARSPPSGGPTLGGSR